ncbi:MAG TPA: polyphenol oxidase family protein [Acidimicrobiia bacterium]
MIRPPFPAADTGSAAAFTEASDGDMRGDPAARRAVSAVLSIPAAWATLTQVHGKRVVEAHGPGDLGAADAVFTSTPGIPIAILTADCAGVVLFGGDAVGVAHAGWRGAAASVVKELRRAMESAGHSITAAAIGPTIGPCCFEVGPEVATQFPGATKATTWGTASVDLVAAIAEELADIECWSQGSCTRHEDGWFSHRRDGTEQRLATVAWVR